MERQGAGSAGAELRVVRTAVRRATPLLAALVVLQLLALATWMAPGTLCPVSFAPRGFACLWIRACDSWLVTCM